MELIFLVLAVIDGIFVAVLLGAFVAILLGDSPLARLARLLLSIVSGAGYFFLCCFLCLGETSVNTSIELGLTVLLLPIGLLGVLKVIQYMFKN